MSNIKFYAPVDFDDTSSGLTIDGDLTVDTNVLHVDTANNRVGIGTTSPGSPLTVAGRVDFQNDLRLRGTDSAANQGIARFYVDSSNSLYIDTANDGSNLFTINSSGNVGIGTTSPTDKLVVNGNIGLGGNKIYNGSASNSAGIDFSDSQVDLHGYYGIRFFASTAGIGSMTERMRIVNNGNVLIGTTTDSGYKLNVNGDATINGVRIGLGGGSVAQNTIVGYGALTSTTTGNYNTALGYQAGYSNTSGERNTAVGRQALRANSTGSYNVALGMNALDSNTASNNTALGYQAGYYNTTGNIVAVGHLAGFSNTTGVKLTAIGQESLRNATGNENTAVGYRAAYNTTTGIHNTALGQQSLLDNTTGSRNTSIGSAALENNTASNNTALGFTAGYSNTTGTIVAVGYEAGYSQTTGTSNTAIGHQSLRDSTASGNTGVGFESGRFNTTGSVTALGFQAARNNTTGTEITAIGNQALRNYTGSESTALGHKAGYSMTTPSYNTVIGRAAAYSTTTGHSNTAIGRSALYNNVTGSKNTAIGINSLVNTTNIENVAIGSYAGDANTTGSNNIFIGHNSDGVAATDSNRTFIGNSSTTSTWLGGNLLLGTTTDDGSNKLQVTGSIKATGSIDLATGGSGSLYLNGVSVLSRSSTYTQLKNAEGAICLYLGDSADRTNYYDNNTHTFRNAGGSSAYVVINSSGNVGIGTTSPSAKLDIVGDGADFFLQSNDFKIARIQPRGTGVNLDKGLFSLFDGSTEDVRIDTAGSSWFNGGNVGIGTSSPTSKTHVYYGGGTTNGLHVQASANRGKIAVSDNDTAAYMIAENSLASFGRQDALSSNNLNITNGGNVLIGTTTDSGYKLDVAGNAIISGANKLYLRDSLTYIWESNGLTLDSGHSTRPIKALIGGSEKFRVHTNGYVGIGNTSPDAHLHINGTGTTASSNQYHLIVGDDNTYGINKGGGIIFRGDYNSSGAQANFGAIRAGKVNANDGNANAYLSLLYGASGVLTEGLRVDYNGNVGIGTSSPSTLLHLAGSTAVATIQDNNSTGNTASAKILFTDNGTFGTIGTVGFDGNDILQITNNHTGKILLSNTVGVNTSSPAYTLDVNGSLSATTLYGDGSNLTGITATETDTLDSVTSRGSTTSNAIGVGGLNVDSGTLYVDSTNNRVGIGTTAPASTLMVHSTGTTAVGKQWQTIISDNNTLAADRGGGIIFRGRYSGTQPANFCGVRAGKLNSTSGDANAYLSLLYGAAGSMTEGVRINYNGNTLIGTTTDSGYKLAVNGDVNADGDYYSNGTQGYTGTVTIQQPSPNPPINIDIQGGIITNVY